jgi:HPt (histidine-containing phosphotransfer) domain-containing protein
MNDGGQGIMPGANDLAGGKPPKAPIDLAHLDRQTMGDKALGREVLALFLAQSLSVRDELGQAGPRQRIVLAHGLKGAARGVGAFAVAECADAIETDPDDAAQVERLAGLVEDVRAFVAALGD